MFYRRLPFPFALCILQSLNCLKASFPHDILSIPRQPTGSHPADIPCRVCKEQSAKGGTEVFRETPDCVFRADSGITFLASPPTVLCPCRGLDLLIVLRWGQISPGSSWHWAVRASCRPSHLMAIPRPSRLICLVSPVHTQKKFPEGRMGGGKMEGKEGGTISLSRLVLISASFLQGCVSILGTCVSTWYYVPDTILDGSSKDSACQCRRQWFDPQVRKIPWRRKWQPTPVFLPVKSQGQRNLVVYSPCGHKKSDTTEQLNKKRYNDEQT